MIHPIAAVDIISFTASLTAMIILLKGWSRALQRDIKLMIAGIFSLVLFHDLSNVLEWSGITNVLDASEDFIEILIPIGWGMVLYGFLKQMVARDFQQSEARYRSLVDNIEFGVTMIDSEHNIVMVNAAQGRMFNKPPHEFIGRKCYREFEKRESVCPHCPGVRATAEGRPAVEETEGVKGDGSRFSVRVHAFPILSSDDQPTGFIEVVEDITADKYTEEALRESEEKYRSFVDNAPVAMYTLNTKGEFTYGNKKLLEITGYKREDWLNNPFHPIVYPEDLEVVARKVEDRIKGRGTADPYEIRILNASGEIMWVKINSESIYGRDEKGEKILVGMQSFVEDVTYKKQAEDTLRESESKFRSLFDFSPQAIALTELETGRLIDVNEKFCELTKFSKQEVLGLTTTEAGFYDDESRNRFIKEIQHSGEVQGLEMDFRAKDGSILHTLMFARIIQISRKPYILTMFLDMTVQKSLETRLAQSQKMEAVGTLTGGIAHDFNNILGIIIANAELAMDDMPDWKSTRFNLEEIRSAGLRGKGVVRQLLSFARKTDQERKATRVVPLVQDSIKLLRATIPTTIGIRIDVQASSDTILADSNQIHQIMINLCTNAFHAMEDTGGVLGVGIQNAFLDEDAHLIDPDLIQGKYLRLTVSDTGKGIPPEIIDKIFDPYFSTKMVGKGTGMGLSVVHGIVKSYDGAISVVSELGKGTTFDLFFPVIENHAITKTETIAELPVGNEKILFVDDELSIVSVTGQFLERLGYQVETQTDPVKALDLFRLNPDRFDLVITDMTMPHMTGDRLAAEILKIRREIPIVLCTGFSEKISEEEARALGIRKYIEKPIKIHDFAEIIRQILEEE